MDSSPRAHGAQRAVPPAMLASLAPSSPPSAQTASPCTEERPAIPRPARDCCQSGCYGCEWGDAMRAHGLI